MFFVRVHCSVERRGLTIQFAASVRANLDAAEEDRLPESELLSQMK